MAICAKQVLSLRAIAKQSGTSGSGVYPERNERTPSFASTQDEISLTPSSMAWPYFVRSSQFLVRSLQFAVCKKQILRSHSGRNMPDPANGGLDLFRFRSSSF